MLCKLNIKFVAKHWQMYLNHVQNSKFGFLRDELINVNLKTTKN